MTRVIPLLAVLLFLLGMPSYAGAPDGASRLPDDVFEADEAEGVLTEARCYFTTGAQGERHKYCGFASLKANLPAGLRTADGRFIYLIVEPRQLASHVESTIRARGRFLPGGRMFRPDELWVRRGAEWSPIPVRN
jgi:hypothetical protein